MRHRKKIAIACQGGGSHTAFTAGVLQELLAAGVHQQYDIVSLSGTSGGGICALLTWYGLLKAAFGSTEPVFQPLLDFWQDNTATNLWEVSFNNWLLQARRLADSGLIPTFSVNPDNLEAWQKFWLNFTPRKEFLDLKILLEKHVDFDSLQQLVKPSSPQLLVGAVNIISGTFKVFDSTKGEITVDSILASCAVPPYFKAVPIEGELYWDGLFAENPPLSRILKRDNRPDEVWIIKINPKARDSEPKTEVDILERHNELAGNILLGAEIELITMINNWLEQGAFTEDFLAKNPVKKIQIRLIAINSELVALLDYASKLDRHPSHIHQLIEDGQKQAKAFLENIDDELFQPTSWYV
ncbi:patatin-like phospholipase family protein [Gloeothece verrucosa]|uniref:Patatin n=1 Tax=Gloeothece verrucosa (strain PCC 7822) TaxID=497965 RepID=E0U695_GLOV7|nr:patatin-like phospholipase family protein [Gloeothece verrucosa]ADN12431.1 Patatin [Gloeothece verrucosa PCC 7822]